MSGLHEKFDEIVAGVPVYGDLDRAIEQADRERRHRYGKVAGLAAAAAVLAVVVGVLAVTRDGDNSQPPIGPSSPTPSGKTTETTAPGNLSENGRLARAEDLFVRAIEPCSVITADYELATPGADCSIVALDVDATAGIGLFQETPTDMGNDPNPPPFVTTLRVATQDAVIRRFPSPYLPVVAELGPGADEISVSHGREITVVGFDGRERRTIDLSAVLAAPEGDRIAEIRSLEWSPDQTRLAVGTRRVAAQGMSSQIWIVDRDGRQPRLVHTATNTESVPANKTPLAYIWSVAWSPDGGRLGFIEEFAYLGGGEVAQSRRAATLTLSGSGASVPRTLYDYPSSTVYDEAEILWSPDGARVALRVPDQVLELSVADGRILDRHPLIAGKLIWPAKQGG
jgi:WD40 repeat protein